MVVHNQQNKLKASLCKVAFQAVIDFNSGMPSLQLYKALWIDGWRLTVGRKVYRVFSCRFIPSNGMNNAEKIETELV